MFEKLQQQAVPFTELLQQLIAASDSRLPTAATSSPENRRIARVARTSSAAANDGAAMAATNQSAEPRSGC